MTILNEDNLVDQKTEQLPGCSRHGEMYLKALVKHARESNAPVEMDLRAVSLTSGPRPTTEHRLVLTPTARPIRHFESLHYARPLGNALVVGYDLVGARRARGLGGFVDLGGANQRVMDELRELMDFIEQFVVVPAMRDTANAAGTSHDGHSGKSYEKAPRQTVRYIIDK